MPDENQTVAVSRISHDLNEIYVKLIGKDPDPEAVKAEAEAFVAKYGTGASLEDMMA
jgi:hypothetical protein